MTVESSMPALEAMLAQTRQLVRSSRRALAASRACLAASAARTLSSETRRQVWLTGVCLPCADGGDLLPLLRSALDQAAIDRETRVTAAMFGAPGRGRYADAPSLGEQR